MSEENLHSDEVSKLKYRGSEIPLFLLVMWTLLLIFCTVYLVKFMLPEFAQAFGK